MFKFIDLFCGIGGFRVALEERGLQCVFSSEIDKHAREAYKANFGELPTGDITKVAVEDIPEHDIICGGFPCQSFSASGNREGLNSAKGSLFYEIIRIAKHHRPRALLLENVKNILGIDDGQVIKTIEKEIRAIGYSFSYASLNASKFGVPQSRERVYFGCVREDLVKSPEVDLLQALRPTYEPVYLKDYLEDKVEERLFLKRKDYVLFDAGQQKPALKPIYIGGWGGHKQGQRIYSTEGHAITLTAGSGGSGKYLVNGKIRKLSINESKRIQGYPESHIVSKGGHGHKQIGNSVIPSMIGRVYDALPMTHWPR